MWVLHMVQVDYLKDEDVMLKPDMVGNEGYRYL